MSYGGVYRIRDIPARVVAKPLVKELTGLFLGSTLKVL
jgi:hypothetical protein